MNRLSKIMGLIVLITNACLFFVFAQTTEERLSIVTYYPSPFGSYRELTWGEQPGSGSRLSGDGNILLGGNGTGFNTPLIQFGTQANAVDAVLQLRDAGNFDIFSGGDDAGSADGTVHIYQNLHVEGDVTINGTVSSAACFNYGTNYIHYCPEHSYAIQCGSGTCAGTNTPWNTWSCPLNGYMICVRHKDN